MKNTCETCGKQIKGPYMEIYTVDSGFFRSFCIGCVKSGYNNLKNLQTPDEGAIDLMVKFESFIKKTEGKSVLTKKTKKAHKI